MESPGTKTSQSAVLQLLLSDEEGEGDVVHVPDEGSHPRCVQVDVQNIPAYGVVWQWVWEYYHGGTF